MKILIVSILSVFLLFFACSENSDFMLPELDVKLRVLDIAQDSISDGITVTSPPFSYSIYPNPFVNILYVAVYDTGVKKIVIVHENGQFKSFETEGQSIAFDLSDSQSGYLYFEILSNGKVYREQILKLDD